LLTRFAPAPTGFLHLGHVVNALYVWRMAQEHGARVLLRIEDHDAQRCRPAYEQALLDDLDWLGFVPDMYPTAAFRAGRCESRQSDRHPLYAEAAARLERAGLLYGCACTRRDLSAEGGSPAEAGGERRYPGTCRDRELVPGPGLNWRVRLAPGVESFDDLLCGPASQDPEAQCGDVIIRDRLGNWTYQFVASVDDWLQGVDLVIRGIDLLPSTGRQIRLARLVGRPEPATFAHHPLIMKSPTQKLSKSDGDTGVGDLRARGWTREQVIGEALRQLPGGRYPSEA
jgi:glutamyl-tRNA synthetase/glutamyl-Q tRNA(Asp) synthetase